MQKQGYGLLGLLMAALVVAACVPVVANPIPMPAEEQPLPTPVSPLKPTITPAQAPTTTRTTPGKASGADNPVALLAQADLAGRLKLTTSQVEIVSVTSIEMPTGSLGCGTPKAPAPPGIVMGEEIVLRAGDRDYRYRTDGRRMVPCRPAGFPGGAEPIMVPGTDPAAFQAVNAAENDLAERIGVAKSEIKLVSTEPVNWPDSSLGCPQPGMMYAQVITPGYRVTLESGDQSYEYHTGGSRLVLCKPGK
jgi:hypothetical protein